MPSRPYDENDETERDGTAPAAGSDQPTEQLVAPTVGDRCSACGAPLVSDQRYCLNCGERRGRARYSFAALTNPAPAAAPAAPRRPRPSSGATLVAGIATLLLAMGVGVLIGHTGNNDNARQVAASPQIITVGGAGAGAGSSVGSTGGTSAVRGHRGNPNAVKAPKVVITKKVAQAAQQSAGKVLGGSANLAPPTVQPGSSCTHGAGCQGGKFTGNFFGGG